ncbi:uncharacterized protein LOC130663224 [Microplitis mediator]|uniref:uncharacterized protein LOC130663224 n=1 Tax=Microplitis mediator TaxID=375433 RepID=UPI0025557DE8|nr:uncharacterized protein LOC130663224 [Microplitis mediator]
MIRRQTASELPYQAVRYRILQGTMDVNTKCEVEPGEKMTALQLAVKKQDWNLIKYLLQNNVRVNTCTSRCEPALFSAIRSGNVSLVKTLIHHRAKINITYNNNTPLHLAVEQNNYAIAEFLIKRRAEVNALTEENRSPLQIAIEKNNINLVKLLIKNNADINVVTKNYETALILSILNEYFDLFKILLDAGAEVNPINLPPLFLAVEKNCYKMTERLIERGADVNTIYNNQTALIIVVEKENMKIAKLLIRNKADVNIEVAAAKTALSVAIIKGNFVIFKMLVDAIADLNSPNLLPLHLAVLQDNYEFTEYLISSGANVNSLDGRRQTPLQISVTKKNKRIINLLLKNNADVNVFDGDNLSPLKIAVINGNEEIVELLLDKAKITVKKSLESLLKIAWNNSTFKIFELLFDIGLEIYPLAADKLVPPLHMAVIKNNFEALDGLISDGVDINGSFWEKTPLEIAVRRGNKKMAELLVKNKANVNLKTGENILHVAVEKNNFELVRMLVDAGADVNSGAILDQAIENNNYKIVEYLISNGAEINNAYENGKWGITPLEHAVKRGYQRIVQLLIEYNVDVNHRSLLEPGCLTTAAENKNFEIFQLLLDSGVNSRLSHTVRTLIYVAVDKNNYEITKHLINHGADVNTCFDNRTLLYRAVENENERIVELLINNKADVNKIIKHKDLSSSFPTALYKAVEIGNLNILKLLINAPSIDVNLSIDLHEPLIHKAIRQNNYEIIKCLIEHGANINTVHDLETPLNIAISNGNKEVVELLIENKADVKAAPGFLNSLLHMAIKKNNFEILDILINIDPTEVYPSYGQPPLLTAVRENNFEMTRYLIKFGADVNTCYDYPLHIAVNNNNKNIVKLLIENKANVNFITESGVSALGIAVEEESFELVKILLDSGANINLSSDKDYSPLQHAIMKGNYRIAKYLINHGANINALCRSQEWATKRDNCCNSLTNCISDSQCSLLQFAIDCKKTEMVKLLIENKVDVRLVERNYPLFMFDVIKYQSHKILELILSTQVDVNCIDTRELGCDETLLHAAVKLKYMNIDKVKLLLMSENFIDVNALAKGGKSVLHYAVDRGHTPIINLLLNAGVKIRKYDAMAVMGHRYTDRQIIIEHIVKLKAANLHLGYESILDLSDEKFNNLYAECLNEIEIMKRTKIVKSNLSYYDVITKSKHKIALGLSRTNFYVKFNSKMLSSRFPLYSGMISYRLDEAQRRRQLLEKSNELLSLVFYGNLSYDIITRINYYLTSRDLKILSSHIDNYCKMIRRQTASELPYQTVRYRILQGTMDVDTKCKVAPDEKLTVLQLAVKNQDRKLINYLLQNNVLVNTYTSKCEPALFLAIRSGNVGLVETLIHHRAKINITYNNTTPLHLAVEQNNYAIAEFLIKRRAEVNALTKQNRSILQIAIKKNNINLVKLLIENNADLNVVTKNYETALILSIKRNNSYLFEILLDAGAEVNSVNLPPLFVAVERKRYTMTKRLIERGADVNTIYNNQTALIIAVENGYMTIVELLIKNKADVNIEVAATKTALSAAIMEGNFVIFKMLVDAIADLNPPSLLPLHLAVLQDNYDFTEYLISSGANVNSLDGRRQTPLHICVMKRNKKLINLLLKNNADVNVFDDDNLSPLKIAVINGNEEIVELLLDKAKITVKKSLESLLKIAWNNSTFKIFELLFDVGLKIYPVAAGKIVPPLHMAVIKNNFETLDGLINDGVDINDSFWEKTPFEIAVGRGCKKMIELLVKNKANVNKKNRENILQVAVKTDNFELMRILIDAGVDVNSGSPLDQAIENDNYEIVKYLITNGANVNSVDTFISSVGKITPLQRAVRKGNKKIVKLLIEYKADVNARPFPPEPACLTTAMQNDNLEIFQLLLDAGADIHIFHNETPLIFMAVDKNNYEITKLLINHGADVNTCFDNKTLLYRAVENENERIVELLITNKVDVNKIIEDKNSLNSFPTALHKAVGIGNLNIVKILVNASNIDVNLSNGLKDPPLHEAIHKNNYKITKCLIEHGANINTDAYKHPLDIAITNGNKEIVQLLIKNKADVDITTESGVTALSIAVLHKSSELVKMLLDAGANVNPSSSIPPLHIAVRYRKIKTAKLLIKNKADVNFITESGESALGIAVEEESFELVEKLLNNGADINLSSDKDYSPLQYAIMLDNRQIAEYLINHGANINALCRRKESTSKRDDCDNSLTNCISDSQCSLLECAIDYEKTEMVKLLIENKVDVRLVEMNNPLFLFDVIKYQSHKILELILSTQVNVNCIDTRELDCRETLLHAALKLQSIDIEKVKLLLMSENFIDINSLTTDGKSALDYAVDRGHRLIVNLLLNAGVKIHRYDVVTVMDHRYTVIQIIIEHIVKLKAANLHLGYESMLDLSDEKLNNLYAECLNEIEIMKKTKIVKSHLSYYDVITKSKHKIALGLSRTNYHVKFDFNMLILQFPSYGGMICYHLNEARRRRQLLEKSNELLSVIFYGNLPYDIISHVNYYLTSRDLKILSSR